MKALTKQADFYLINYENLTWLLNLKDIKLPDILILDESTKIKNYASLRFRGRGKRKNKKTGKFQKPLKGLQHVLPNFEYRYIMTGTPKPGEYEQLWPQIYIVDEGRRLLANITQFRYEHYFQYGPMHYQRKLKTGHDAIIQKSLQSICYRISEDDLEQQLPRVVRRNYFIDLPSDVRDLYDEFEEDMIVELGSGQFITADSVGVKLNRLRQIAQGAVYTTKPDWEHLHDEKIDMLDALVEGLGERRAIVTYAFRHDLERMLKWRKAPVLHSGLNNRDYNDTISKWNSGSLPLLFGFPGSMGHGLNLQAGGYDIIMFGLSWGLELYQQVVGRLRRTGQESKRVWVHRILARGTVEEDLMLPRLRHASESQEQFLESFRRYKQSVAKRNQRLKRYM
jgi:hypothetical protein